MAHIQNRNRIAPKELPLFSDTHKKHRHFMKPFLSAVFLISAALGLKAQGGTVYIEQDPRIDTLIQQYTEVNTEVGFYQIQVGFGNYQSAQELKTQVDVDFPDWGSSIVFESPTYRVRLGKFKTKLEAERKYWVVRKKYHDAILLKP